MLVTAVACSLGSLLSLNIAYRIGTAYRPDLADMRVSSGSWVSACYHGLTSSALSRMRLASISASERFGLRRRLEYGIAFSVDFFLYLRRGFPLRISRSRRCILPSSLRSAFDGLLRFDGFGMAFFMVSQPSNPSCGAGPTRGPLLENPSA